MSGAAEATRPGGVGRLPLAREAASPETPPLVPLLAFQQLKPGLRCHQSTCPAARPQQAPHSRPPRRAAVQRTCEHGRTRQSAAAPPARSPRQLALARSDVAELGAASHTSPTGGSASGRRVPGTLPAVSPAEMGVWAEPRAGGAAPTPI